MPKPKLYVIMTSTHLRARRRGVRDGDTCADAGRGALAEGPAGERDQRELGAAHPGGGGRDGGRDGAESLAKMTPL